MARGGIYKSEVVRARNNLLSVGRYPSIDAIRTELGNTGSKSTIQRYIKEIEEEEGGRTGQKVAVSEAIQELAARLAERLHEEANQRIQTLSDKHKTEITDLNATTAALKDEVNIFRAQVEQLTIGLADEKTAHAETQTQTQQEKVTHAQLAQRIQDMEEQLSIEESHRQSLEEKHQHAREALEHFRAAAKEQKEQDHRQFEQQIQFLQTELRDTKYALNTKQQELISSHKDNARLSSELTQSRNSIHRLDTELRSLKTVKEQLRVAESKNQQLTVLLEAAETRISDLSEKNREYEIKLSDALASEQRVAT